MDVLKCPECKKPLVWVNWPVGLGTIKLATCVQCGNVFPKILPKEEEKDGD